MKTLLIFLIAFVSACTPMRFENISSKNTFDQDKYDCQVLLGYRGHTAGVQPTDQLFDYAVRGQYEMQKCLERKGWRLVQG